MGESVLRLSADLSQLPPSSPVSDSVTVLSYTIPGKYSPCHGVRESSVSGTGARRDSRIATTTTSGLTVLSVLTSLCRPRQESLRWLWPGLVWSDWLDSQELQL